MNISQNKYDSIHKIFKKLNGIDGMEIEARFGNFDKRVFSPFLTLEQFSRVMNFFLKHTSQFYEYTISHEIVSYSEHFKKVSRYSPTSPVFYINPLIEENFFITKEKKACFDLLDYNLRLSFNQEYLRDIDDSSVEYTQEKIRKRHTFISHEALIKFEVSEYYFQGQLNFDIEVECLKGCSLDTFMKNIELVLCIIQESESGCLLSKSEANKVLKHYFGLPVLSKKKKFIGIQPETLSTSKLSSSCEYSVTKKLDGQRYLLCSLDQQAYLISNFLQIKKFPYRVPKEYEGILFDGELFRGDYHIFDVISDDFLEKRIDFIKTFASVVRPLENSRCRIYVKEYYFGKLDELMKNLSTDLPEYYDGLIVIKTQKSYMDCGPLKWKKQITIDFSIAKKQKGTFILQVASKTGLEDFAEMNVDDHTFSNLQEGTIVECFYADDSWGILRVRYDKTRPNFVQTAKDNFEGIKKPYIIGELPAPKRHESAFFNMRRFHNYIKRHYISQYSGYSVLDLACGKGGDLGKYIDSNVKVIEGYDINEESIAEANKRKECFLNKATSKNITINVSVKNLLTDSVESSTGTKFDLVTCNFAYHYFYKSPEKVLQSIASNTKKGSRVIITLMDPSKIEEEDNENYSLKLLGDYQVEVYLKDSVLNTPEIEYLVPKEGLIQQLKKCHFKLVDFKPFSELYSQWKDHGNSLSNDEMKFSFMNVVYVFVRE